MYNRNWMLMSIAILLSFSMLMFIQNFVEHTYVLKSRQFYEQQGEIVWDVHTNQKVIALTFDDGPHPIYTPRILDILKRYEAKATFFVNGIHVDHFPEIAQRQVEEGHELGNHTYSHRNFNTLTSNEIMQELEQTSHVIQEATGQYPTLFRPPGGHFNDMVIETSKAAGYNMILWSYHQDPKDWSKPGIDIIVETVVSKAAHGDIVLLHDFGDNREQTIQALEEIIPELKAKGFELVTVSELLSLRTEIE